MAHKKQLSKADEEMEEAMEEMKRMNQMIADEDARRVGESKSAAETGADMRRPKESKSAAEAEERLAGAMKRNADELEIQPAPREKGLDGDGGLPSPNSLDRASPKAHSSSGDEQSRKGDAVHTPLTPRSSIAESSGHESISQFTNFDQLVAPGHDDADGGDEAARKPPPLTLHNAAITSTMTPLSTRAGLRASPRGTT